MWSILWSCTAMFHNLVPSLEVTTYSVHINTCTHTTFNNGSPSGDMSPHSESETDFKQLYPWQKVSDILPLFPHFFFSFYFLLGTLLGMTVTFTCHLLLLAMALWVSRCQWSTFTPSLALQDPPAPFFCTPSTRWLDELVNVFGSLKGLSP
jgi:hypothetical protein